MTLHDERVTVSLGDAGVAQVRLNRPDKLNALDPAMFDALLAVGEELSTMAGMRCVVLAGAGRAFCAGLDMASFASRLAQEAATLADRTHRDANRFQQVALQWRNLSVPVIAAISGVCVGGGLQIAAGADIRIATPDARLSVAEVQLGLVPDMGGFAAWRGLVRDDVLRELTYTGREFSGAAALDMGFVTATDPDPLARAIALAREIAERNPHAVRAAKALFARAADSPLADILQAESLAQAGLLGSPNQLEAVRARMERRSPIFSD